MLAAAAILVADPSAWQSSAFILSFLSLAGIYLLAPPMRLFLREHAKPDVLGWHYHLAAAVAVNAAIAPVIAVAVGQFPLISFVSNILIAPSLGTALVSGAALALPGARFIFAPIVRLVLLYEIAVSRFFAAAPFMISGSLFPLPAVAIYYLILAGFAIRYASQGRVAVRRPAL
jgi:predicted membrane metal-binding protein